MTLPILPVTAFPRRQRRGPLPDTDRLGRRFQCFGGQQGNWHSLESQVVPLPPVAALKTRRRVGGRDLRSRHRRIGRSQNLLQLALQEALLRL